MWVQLHVKPVGLVWCPEVYTILWYVFIFNAPPILMLTLCLLFFLLLLFSLLHVLGQCWLPWMNPRYNLLYIQSNFKLDRALSNGEPAYISHCFISVASLHCTVLTPSSVTSPSPGLLQVTSPSRRARFYTAFVLSLLNLPRRVCCCLTGGNVCSIHQFHAPMSKDWQWKAEPPIFTFAGTRWFLLSLPRWECTILGGIDPVSFHYCFISDRLC